MKNWLWGEKKKDEDKFVIKTTVTKDKPRMVESKVRAFVEFEIEHPYDMHIQTVLTKINLNFTLPEPCDVGDAEVNSIQILGTKDIIKNESGS